MKIRTLLLIISILLSILSCSLGTPGNLVLSNIPINSSEYQLEVYYWNDSFKLINNVELGTVSPGTSPSFDLDIPPAAAYISFYLLVADRTTPLFFYEIAISSVNGYIQNSLWLDYDGYFYNDKIRYGFGEESVTTLVSGSTLTLDYSDSPYYVLKVATRGESIFSSLSITTENDILYRESDSLGNLADELKYYGSDSSPTIESNFYGDLYVYLQHPQTTENYTSIINYSCVPFIETSDEILDFCTTNSDDLILAISDLSHELYLINPITSVITEKIQMPLQSLTDIEYSSVDNDVYMLAPLSHTILIYDLDTDTSSQHVYSSQSGYGSLAVDDNTRRVYASTNDYIYMLDMDNNLNELGSSYDSLTEFNSYSYDPANQIIYTNDYSEALQYTITDTDIEKSILETGTTTDAPDNINIDAVSPDGDILASTSGWSVYTIATSDMSFISEWAIDFYIDDVIFDNDGSHIFTLTAKNTSSISFIKRTETFNFSNEIESVVPGGASKIICAENGEKIIGFFSDTLHTGIFFMDIQ